MMIEKAISKRRKTATVLTGPQLQRAELGESYETTSLEDRLSPERREFYEKMRKIPSKKLRVAHVSYEDDELEFLEGTMQLANHRHKKPVELSEETKRVIQRYWRMSN